MRTTVTLDADVAARLRQVAQERGISFKKALNSALRAGLGGPGGSSRPYRVEARPLGLRPGINLDKSVQIAADDEDLEAARKLELRK